MPGPPRRGGNFENLVKIPTGALGTVTVKRGWVFDDLRLLGRRSRFVNTHLEAYGTAERQAQARGAEGHAGRA